MRRALAAVAVAVAMLTTAPAAQARPMALRLPPCKYEDGSGGPRPCIWDATTRGNGTGRSYWVDRRGHVHYLPTVRWAR